MYGSWANFLILISTKNVHKISLVNRLIVYYQYSTGCSNRVNIDVTNMTMVLVFEKN